MFSKNELSRTLREAREELRRQITEDLKDGLKQSAIARKHGCGLTLVVKIAAKEKLRRHDPVTLELVERRKEIHRIKEEFGVELNADERCILRLLVKDYKQYLECDRPGGSNTDFPPVRYRPDFPSLTGLPRERMHRALDSLVDKGIVEELLAECSKGIGIILKDRDYYPYTHEEHPE